MARLDVHDKWALVTGAGTRIGAAIAVELAHGGCNVIVHYRANRSGAERVVEAVKALGRDASLAQADLCDRGAIRDLAVATTDACEGSLDILINNAANFERVPPGQLDAGAWDRALELNATAPYLLTLALESQLRAARGTMIGIACTSAMRPWKNFVPYSVSKAALTHLVRGLAIALAPDVRVNAVAPGAALVPDDYDDTTREQLLRRIPLARFGDADDVARAVRFLAENDYVTGHVLVVDGGLSLV